MSDRVIDISPVPTEAQRERALAERRIGLGITGLATALMLQSVRYGSMEAVKRTEEVMCCIRDAAYRESIQMAREYGPFPLFDRDKYLAGEFVMSLPEDIREGISDHGIRNALLLTCAPTGTVSIAQCLNSSAGLEPVFLPRYRRRKLEGDGSYSEHEIEDLGFRTYADVMFSGNMDVVLAAPLPDYMATTADLTPEDHLVMQAAVQRYVDNSVSKTINVPTETSFEAFAHIYERAYKLGCKGCTTYRPDPTSGRGEVLSAIEQVPTAPIAEAIDAVGAIPIGLLRQRPDVLDGRTYRLRWHGQSMYVVINDEVLEDGRRVPFEMFIKSRSVDSDHWISLATRLSSAIMRREGDFSFLPEEWREIYSARGGEFIGQRYVPSEIALIGECIHKHFVSVGYTAMAPAEVGYAELCPECHQPTIVREEGCEKCISCSYNKCG